MDRLLLVGGGILVAQQREVGPDPIAEVGEGDVWLSGGPEFQRRIATEYKEMKAMDLCEEEYASVAKEELLLRRARHPI